MNKYLFGSICAIVLIALTGCGANFNYDPYWKAYSVNTGAKWEVNADHYIKDSDTVFQWTIYTATKSRTPDFTYWTTQSSWKEITTTLAKKQLGVLWRLVPNGHFYLYELSTPSTSWVMSPATMVGVATSQQNNNDNKRLVKDILYGSVNASPIFLTTTPLQLTSISTNQSQQSITYTWKPLSSSGSS